MPRIYHFTDVANLERILESGELRCHRHAPTCVEVGSASIKASRARISARCGPGGEVCDYVPFYFATRSPMLYTITRGNVEGVSPDQRPLVYLVTSTEAVYAAGLACVFTDGNAATAFTTFSADPAELANMVDWPLMRARQWAGTEQDKDRRRRRMAEFLVHEAVPTGLLTAIGVFDEAARATVAGFVADAGLDTVVGIRRAWYF